MKKTLTYLFFLLAAAVTVEAQTAYDEPADVAHKYFELSLKFIKETNGFSPPVASRALGYSGLCLYESVVHGLPNYNSLVGDLPELNALPQPSEGETYSWAVVANNAMSLVMDSLYDNKSLDNKVLLYAARTEFNIALQAQLPADVYDRSVAYGELIGQAIFDYSKTESGYRSQYKNFPSSYVPPIGEEYWSPLTGQSALQPYWGNNRAFMPENVTNGTLPPPPPGFSTDSNSIFYAYANQVYTTGVNLTQAQKDIATFWADGGGTFTPPGHSISMLRQLLREEDWNLGQSAVAYAKLGLSLSDAFLACWKTKYIHNLCRPVTYIKSHINPDWSPFIGTPPFPEYPSGHSSQSGAWSVVMTHLFGDDYAFSDSTYASVHGVRSFTDFESCAQETAVSRLYGGIHYDFGNQNGSYLGRTIGENIINLFQQVLPTVERHQVPSLQIFPSPAREVVFIKHMTPSMTSFRLTSITGSTMKAGVMNGNGISLDGLAAGLYIVTVFDGNGHPVGQQKLVVQ